MRTTSQNVDLTKITRWVRMDKLERLSILVSECDNRNQGPSLETIGEMHQLIQEMAGEHACLLYSVE